MLSTTDFKRGLKIEMDGTPYEIMEFQHVKPGKGGAFVRTKLRNLTSGKVVEKTFRSGEKVDKPNMETRVMQYLYKEGQDYVFMDMTTYEQINVTDAQTGGKGKFLKDGQESKVLLYNEVPLDVDIPASVVLTVTETEAGARGDTVSTTFKPAVLETGHPVNVPLFINIGDNIKVDTRSGDYISRG